VSSSRATVPSGRDLSIGDASATERALVVAELCGIPAARLVVFRENKEAMMRKTLVTLMLIATVLAACSYAQPGKPTPTVLGTQGPGQTTEPLPHY